MEFLQDTLNEEFGRLNHAWHEIDCLDVDHLKAEEDYLLRLRRCHDVQCYWMERQARSMPTFNSGYRNACAPDSPVREREDTVEFWRNVIDGAQCVLDLQSDCERRTLKRIPDFYEIFVDEGLPAIQLNIRWNRITCERLQSVNAKT